MLRGTPPTLRLALSVRFHVIPFVFLQAFLNKHCGELVSVCEAHLSSIILSENGTKDLNEELMVRARLSVVIAFYCIFFSTQVKM